MHAVTYTLEPGAETTIKHGSEWLLTAGNGGYAMGSPLAINNRKYHALLIAAANPPVHRIACLNAIDESITVDGAQTLVLTSHRRSDGSLHPDATGFIEHFEKSTGACTWQVHAGPVRMTRTLTLIRVRAAAEIHYEFHAADRDLRITLAPLLSIRDSHATNENPDLGEFTVLAEPDACTITRAAHSVRVAAPGARFEADPALTEPVLYEQETDRGYPDTERLFRPGAFTINAESGAALTVTITAELPMSNTTSRHRSARREPEALQSATGDLPALASAADDFLVTRTVKGESLTSIIAGYPWFTDWGRDTMIALPGLLLVTGRHDEALSCLQTFARHTDKGMIPNVFDDHTGEPHYNTVDASLWFIHACCEYRLASGDHDTFVRALLPACEEILEHYRTGTRFGIHADPADDLITAGDETTQLTWMDAKRDHIVFTPRHGKAVEINALWHHAHLTLADAIVIDDPSLAQALRTLARPIAQSFIEKFWNHGSDCLYDCLQGSGEDERPLPHIRPNQVIAAALEHAPLSPDQRRDVVRCARNMLLTPRGLRTLSPDDPAFEPRFEGNMMNRDRAYHNGTAWPWLLGPYCEALLRAHDFSADAVAETRAVIAPLIESMHEGCLGQIAEVYDATPPQREGGCPAQAWSVAEILRIASLIESL